MKDEVLYEYGLKQVYDNPDIIKTRKVCNILDLKFYHDLEKYVKEKDVENINIFIRKNIIEILEIIDIQQNVIDNIRKGKIEVIHRFQKGEDNYHMGWHFDDRKLIIQNIKNKDKLHNLEVIKIKDHKIYALYNKSSLPIYTIIIYFDTYNIDFIGGEIEFINLVHYPKKGDLLLFDSREIHRVKTLIRGIRRCLAIKFYLC